MSTQGVSPESIENHYKVMFKSGIEAAVQQKDTRVWQFMEQASQTAEFDYYDRIGIAGELKDGNARYGDNPVGEFDHDRRRLSYSWLEDGKMIDPKDLLRVANDPTNEYSMGMVASANRTKDKIVFQNIYGPAYTGKSGGTVVNFASTPASGKIKVGALSAGNINPITTAGRYELEAGTEGIVVASDYTGGTAAETGITIAKLKAIRATMMRIEAISQDTILNCHITSAQFEQLLGITEVINSDYAIRKSLAEGQITTFMGYRFIHSEHVPVDGAGKRRCLVSLPKAYKCVTAADITTDIWRLPHKKNIPYLYLKMGLGGSRMWGEYTVEMKCND